MTSAQTRSKTRQTIKVDTVEASTSSTLADEVREPTEAPWEKVLWRKQPYPDNYVPPSFLAELNDIRECLAYPAASPHQHTVSGPPAGACLTK